MSNLNTFGAHLSDFWPYVAKIGKPMKMRVWGLKIFLRFSYYYIDVKNMHPHQDSNPGP